MKNLEEKLFRKVNKRSKTPYYIQIKNQILDAIENKKINDGHQLLNENLLTEIFDVNRLTLRNALRELDLDGYIKKRKGYGTFISTRKKISYLSQEVSYYSDQLKEENLQTILVSNKIEIPPKEIINKLNLGTDYIVNYIERYRVVENEPVFFSYIFIPVIFCEKFEDEDIEKYSIVRLIEEKFGNKIKRIERFLEYTNPKKFKKISKALHLTKEEGLFYLQSYLFNEDNMIVGYFQDYLGTSNNKFSFYIEK